MITGLIIVLAVLAVGLVSSLIASAWIAIDPNVGWAFSYIFHNVTALNGIFPVGDVLAAISFVMLAWIAVYTVKVVLWAWGFVPLIGRMANLPDQGSKEQPQSLLTMNSISMSEKVVYNDQSARLSGYFTRPRGRR